MERVVEQMGVVRIALLSAVMGCKRAARGKLAMLSSIVMSVGGYCVVCVVRGGCLDVWFVWDGRPGGADV